jgi:predicted CopG family antitoxin
MRAAKSFTIEEDVNEYVASTKGERSASERVNELLRRAILQEQAEQLSREAAAFFSDPRNAGRKETRAFQEASRKALARD